jgi:nitric oxide reductase NorE protein
LFLLTSSLLVLCGVTGSCAARVKQTPQRLASPLPFLLEATGCVGASRAAEYTDKLKAGIGLTTNEFFAFYFMLTGIHLAHVLVGLVLLGCVWHRARLMDGRGGPLVLVEVGASYWHMVDLLWIVLFPLLYLMRPA